MPAKAANGINHQINYQAKLSDTSGFAVADGNYAFKFTIYDALSGGNALWTATGTLATPTAVTTTLRNGLFTILLGDTSSTAGSQNPLDNSIDWNSDSLYLGVSVNADSEMSPRKRLGAVPQAFNAERLQGMYASGTAFGANSVFVVSQTSATAATGTRSALEIRSSGTSNANDFLIRGINDTASQVFSVNRQGSVTSSGIFASTGAGTSTFAGAVSSTRAVFDQNVLVNGKLVCLSDGTNCAPSSGSSDWTYVPGVNTSVDFVRNATVTTDIVLGATATNTAPFFFSIATSTVSSSRLIIGQNQNADLVIGNATSSGMNSLFQLSGNDLYVEGNIGSATSVYTNGAFIAGPGSTYYGDGFINKNNGNLTIDASGGFITPSTDLSVSLGSTLLRYNGIFGNTTSTSATSTNLFANNVQATNGTITTFNFGSATGSTFSAASGTLTNLNSTNVNTVNATTTNLFATNGTITNLTSSAFNAGNLTWTNATGTNTTSTNLFANNVQATNGSITTLNFGSATGATFSAASGTLTNLNSTNFNSINATSSFLAVTGPATSTFSGSAQAFGNVSSTNLFASGFLNVFGNVTLGDASTDLISANGRFNTDIIPNTDGTLSLGSIANRWNAYLSNVTSTNATTTNLFATNGSITTFNFGSATGATFSATSGTLTNLNTTNLNAVNATSAFFAVTGPATSTFTGSIQALGNVTSTNLFAGGFLNVFGNTILGDGSTDLISTNGTFNTNILPNADGTLSLGSVSSRWNAYLANVTSTNATTTNFFAVNASTTNLIATNFSAANVIWTNATGTNTTSTNLYATSLSFLNATGTSATTSNLAVTNSIDNTLHAYSDLHAVGSLVLNNAKISGMFVSGRYAYVPTQSGPTSSLTIVDLTNPSSPSSTAVVRTDEKPMNVYVSGRYAYVVNETLGSMNVIDVQNPTGPAVVASTTGFTTPFGVFVQGRYAYVTNRTAGSLSVVDVGNPLNPVIVGDFSGMSAPKAVYVLGRYAYVAQSGTKLVSIIDIANPHSPVQVGVVNLAGGSGINNVFVQGKFLYLTDSTISDFAIFDVSVPTTPRRVTPNLGVGNVPEDNGLFVSGRYMYITGADAKLHVFDVKDPTSVETVAAPATVTSPNGLFVAGRYAYVGDGGDGTLQLIDIDGIETNGLIAHSAELGSLQVMTNGAIANELSVGGGLSVGQGGIQTDGSLTVSATNTTSSVMGGFIVGTSTYSGSPLNALFVMNGNDLFVQGNIGSASSVYTNGEFVAGSGSTHFGNGYITGDSTLRVKSTGLTLLNGVNNLLQTDGTISSLGTTGGLGGTAPESVAVNGRYAYVLAKGNGTAMGNLTVINAQNPNAPSVVGNTNLGGVNAQTLVVKGHYAFATLTGANAMNIIDVSDPGRMRVIATTTAMTNAYGVTVKGSVAYVTSNGGGTTLSYADVTDPYNPGATGSFGSFSGAQGITTAGRYLYVVENTAQQLDIIDASQPFILNALGSVSTPFSPTTIAVQGRYAYIGYTDSATFSIVDVATSTGPIIANTVAISGATASSRNGMFVNGRYLYILTTGDNALHIFDITSAASPTEIKTLGLAGASNGVFVAGRYVYVGYTAGDKLQLIDQTGVETTSLTAQSADVGTLQVLSSGEVANALTVGGSLTVGHGGIFSEGPVAINASGTMALSVVGGGANLAKVVGTSTSPVLIVQNTASNNQQTTWGAYIDKLLVGDAIAATGTGNFPAVISFTGSATRGGLCVDDISNASTCRNSALTNVSISADTAIAANDFDLAEAYQVSGAATSSDLLVVDSAAAATVKTSTGIPYDGQIIGIASTRPGFLLGAGGGVMVALTGRVPTKVSAVNGAIAIGDPLTSSQYPGYAMKATKPGMIVGYALDAANATSTIEVFVKVGYDARSVLSVNAAGTVTQLTDNLVVTATSTASSASPTVDSWGLTFRGSAWNGASAVNADYTLSNDILSSTTSRFSIKNASSTELFSVDQSGTARVTNDLIVSGRLFPSARGVAQTDKYIFLDNTGPGTSTYMATNADGWQANSSYDYAERYYSPDALEPGDLVMASERGRLHVQRSLDEKQPLLGIVSTKPGFVAGARTTSTYPIALAGRVPTKVSTLKGKINTGDPLAPSTIPGIAVKATVPGPIVGYALETYDGADVGLIEVFVNPGWWGTNAAAEPIVQAVPVAPVASPSMSHQGYALITAGSKEVHVSYASIHAYPNVQVTPHGEVDGGWWTDHYTDVGFDIIIKLAQPHDVSFAWRVEPSADGQTIYLSDGTASTMNSMTGEPTVQPTPPPTDTVTSSAAEPIPVPTSTVISTDPATSTTPVTVPIPDPIAATSTSSTAP